MSRLKCSVFLGLVAVLAGACDDISTPAEPGADPVVDPTLSFADGPATPSPYIVRTPDAAVFFINTDPAKDRLSLHFHTDNNLICGGDAFFDVAERQVVTTPSQADEVLVLIKNRESHVSVYSTSSLAEAGLAPFNPAVFCSFINGPKKIASGVVDHVQTLSDVSFEARWGGELQGAEGATYGYNEHLVFQVLPSGESRTTQTDIRLNVRGR